MPPATRCWAVFPAAGRGQRFGAERPKQYLEVAGRTLLEHAVAPFLELPDLAAAVIALAAEDRHFGVLPLAADARVETVEGGTERHHSVLAALRALDARAGMDDWVLVHDVARPCLSAATLARLRGALADDGVGGLLAIPVVDTLKSSGDGEAVDATVDRRGLWRAQTPQQFRYGLLRTALEAVVAGGGGVTDEAQAIEAAGYRPRLIVGEERNIKVTRPEDLALAAFYLGA